MLQCVSKTHNPHPTPGMGYRCRDAIKAPDSIEKALVLQGDGRNMATVVDIQEILVVGTLWHRLSAFSKVQGRH
jgi:hypothetical protein